MIEPPPNLTSKPYRGLSVQDVDVELAEGSLLEWITEREVYRRTEFLLARRERHAALLELDKEPGTDLFLRVVGARVLALPEDIVMIDSPTTDVGNATALAGAVAPHRRAHISTYVVTGRYRHVNFLRSPAPVTLYVDEVVPPHPAKLIEMVHQAIAFDEDLPPIDVVSRLVPIPTLMRAQPSAEYLLPCRGAGDDAANVSYLDAGPESRRDWILVGCARSRQIFDHHYHEASASIDFCPEVIGEGAPPGLRLTKCCQLERGTRVSNGVAVVPWGANLDEVRSAILALVSP